ncbi:MAG: dephospho-CoA kinase [Armatimonadota bacterium]|nr:dephospho-CoA kinase [Armatimonadota bacterium]MDR7520537.1 dephospho-CoA kinase [Armatimonadota bacterium]MDR7551233.1 dephospho-CoA kinase [Armatimonadota bacterium]
MKVIGLTGGIASGKSLVAGLLRDLGAWVIDADEVAREVTAPGSEALREIAEAFGPTVVGPDGALDRKALADRIFSDPQARQRLNAITHPRIRRRIVEEIAAVRARQPQAIVVVDVPLLLDTAPADAYPFDGVVVVYADEAAQLARLAARDGLTEEAARRRLAAQRPLREKVPLATWVIDNSGPPEATRRQVEALWRRWHGTA